MCENICQLGRSVQMRRGSVRAQKKYPRGGERGYCPKDFQTTLTAFGRPKNQTKNRAGPSRRGLAAADKEHQPG